MSFLISIPLAVGLLAAVGALGFHIRLADIRGRKTVRHLDDARARRLAFLVAALVSLVLALLARLMTL